MSIAVPVIQSLYFQAHDGSSPVLNSPVNGFRQRTPEAAAPGAGAEARLHGNHQHRQRGDEGCDGRESGNITKKVSHRCLPCSLCF
jgi:hypothetical protein